MLPPLWGWSVLHFHSHGLRRGLHSFAALRLGDGRDVRRFVVPSIVASSRHQSFRVGRLQTLLLQSGVRVLKNRMESALAARFGPVYLMI